MFHYEAQEDDEISLKEGEVKKIFGLEKCKLYFSVVRQGGQ